MGRIEGTESFLGRGRPNWRPHRQALLTAEPEYVFGAAESAHQIENQADSAPLLRRSPGTQRKREIRAGDVLPLTTWGLIRVMRLGGIDFAVGHYGLSFTTSYGNDPFSMNVFH